MWDYSTGENKSYEITQENFSKKVPEYIDYLYNEGLTRELTDSELYNLNLIMDAIMGFNTSTTDELKKKIKNLKPEYYTMSHATLTKDETDSFI